MQFLRLENNELTGTIPSTIGDMTELVDLRLNNNTLSGPIPFTFYGLNKLRKFYRSPLKDQFTKRSALTRIVNNSDRGFEFQLIDRFHT